MLIINDLILFLGGENKFSKCDLLVMS